MRGPGLSALALCLATALATPAHADVDGSRYESTEWKVRLTAPRNWQLTERTSYPHVLLWMARPPDARMLLSAERVATGETAVTYAARTSKLLEAMGFTLRAPQLHSATGAYWVDFNNSRVYLRQAFVVIGDIGYSLTLSAPDSRRRSQHLRAFDYALRSIRPMRKATDGRSGTTSDEAPDSSSAEPPSATEP